MKWPSDDTDCFTATVLSYLTRHTKMKQQLQYFVAGKNINNNMINNFVSKQEN